MTTRQILKTENEERLPLDANADAASEIMNVTGVSAIFRIFYPFTEPSPGRDNRDPIEKLFV